LYEESTPYEVSRLKELLTSSLLVPSAICAKYHDVEQCVARCLRLEEKSCRMEFGWQAQMGTDSRVPAWQSSDTLSTISSSRHLYSAPVSC